MPKQFRKGPWLWLITFIGVIVPSRLRVDWRQEWEAELHYRESRLAEWDPRMAKIVELRAFGGLTIEEAAHVLSVSPSTAKRDWRTAKAWLNRELGSGVRP